MNTSRTQDRLRVCWEQLEKAQFGTGENSAKDWSAILTLLKKTVGHIHTNGLLMALLFLRTRRPNGAATYQLIEKACEEMLNLDDKDLLCLLREGDLTFLSLVTDECVEAVNIYCWYMQGAGVKARAEDEGTDGQDADE